MKLTVGMASFNNRFEVWATVQNLRINHDMADTEIVVVDNFGDEALRGWCAGHENVRYFLETAIQGTSYPRDMIIQHARGEWVIVIDPHVFLLPGVVQRFKEWAENNNSSDLFHGPMLYDDLTTEVTSMRPDWGGHMWGVWDNTPVDGDQPVEIPMHGMGLYATRKDSWLGYAKGCSGFGGEEGTIHEKYRAAGRKVFLLPWMKWNHYFKNSRGSQDKVPFRLTLEDRVRNYLLGFAEIGLDIQPIVDNFGQAAVDRALTSINCPRFSVVYYSDERNPEPVRKYCLERLRETVAACGGEVVVSINSEGNPSHERLFNCILAGLDKAHTDWIFFAEDDVLYPAEHFNSTPGINTFGFNLSVWHLSAEGFFPNSWSGTWLQACFGHRDALRAAIGKKLAEAKAGTLAHAEPDAPEKTWTTNVPVVDVRHGGNFTGMRENVEYAQSLDGWGDAAEYIVALGLA